MSIIFHTACCVSLPSLLINPFAVSLVKLDPLCYGNRERSVVRIRIGSAKHKHAGLGLTCTIPRWVMFANLGEQSLAEHIESNPLQTDAQQQKKWMFTGLAINPSEAAKQYMSRARRISSKEKTSESLKQKAEQLKDALDQLEQRRTQTNFDTYASLIRHCADAKALTEGRRLHAHIVRSRFARNRFLANLLVQMYGRCGSLEDARAVFDKISQPNAFSRSIMIAAYTRNGLLDDARSLFDKMLQRDVVSWNAMIAAYAQNGRGKEALEIFRQMDLEGVKPDKVTFISVLDACASLAALVQGQGIHARIVDSGFETDVVVGNVLVNMYGKCGSPDDAWSVFDKMPQRDVVSWNGMIAAFVQNGRGNEAFNLFRQMDLEGVKPDKITFVCILDACRSLVALAKGQEIHNSILDSGFEKDVVVGTALINMYGKCGSLHDARSVFDNIRGRDVVAWTAMIAAYSQNGNGEKALELFRNLDMEGMKPDKVTFICIVDACASLGALKQGQGIHASIADCGLETDAIVGTALLNMYGKCGNPDEARCLFDMMSRRVVVSWNAMIAAYAQNGRCNEALKLFQCMKQEDVEPDMVTFISIISACSHAGLLDDGWQFLISMSRDHSIGPTADHYVCMIDLIGRAGQLDEAEDLINNMPSQPDAVAWMAFLGACRLYGDVERGACAAKHVFELDSKKASPYVLLSNIYAAAGRQDDVATVRQAMWDRGVKKHPGFSYIEVKKRVHQSVAGDVIKRGDG